MVYAIYAPVYGEFTKIDQGTVVDLAAFVIRNGARRCARRAQRLAPFPIGNATKSTTPAWSIFANSPYIGA